MALTVLLLAWERNAFLLSVQVVGFFPAPLQGAQSGWWAEQILNNLQLGLFGLAVWW